MAAGSQKNERKKLRRQKKNLFKKAYSMSLESYVTLTWQVSRLDHVTISANVRWDCHVDKF